MNLSTYQKLTGITVPDNQKTLVEAQIRRTQKILEGLLGFTLNPKKVEENLYNEQGKTTSECACPDVEPEELDEPDAVVGAYRLYPYNEKDQYFHIDPFTEVHAVKLVWNNITIKTFDPEEFRVDFMGEWGKYVENCQNRICVCKCTDCVQLAVDADWKNFCKHNELMYIWADMVTYYADCKKDVRQESIGSHSYTKFDKDNAEPEMEINNRAILKKYAGPYGSLTKVITI